MYFWVPCDTFFIPLDTTAENDEQVRYGDLGWATNERPCLSFQGMEEIISVPNG